VGLAYRFDEEGTYVSAPGLNPLSFNAFVQQIGALAVALVSETAGVWSFNDAPLQTVLPQMLSYSEARIQRDLDLLASQTSNTYTVSAGANVFPLPINDFLVIQTIEWTQSPGGPTSPLVPVSKEFIQNVYGPTTFGPPQYFAMYGDNFGNGGDVNNNIYFGPTPNYAFTINVTGTIRTPSLYQYASAGIADTEYSYISANYPDLLIMASMIFVTMYQRNFGGTSDDPNMGMNYEKQYQALKTVAVMEENRKKLMGSGWSPYSTPVSATPTR
jgi:hypothetical protein